MATQETLKGNWNTIVESVKEKYNQITSDDLSKVQGNFDRFAELMQRKAGQTRKQVEQLVDSCCADAGHTYHKVVDSVGDAASQAGHYMKDRFDTTVENVEQGYDSACSMVEQSPMKSVAVVAGVALLAGVMLGISLANRR